MWISTLISWPVLWYQAYLALSHSSESTPGGISKAVRKSPGWQYPENEHPLGPTLLLLLLVRPRAAGHRPAPATDFDTGQDRSDILIVWFLRYL
jgi:hypothetical protein